MVEQGVGRNWREKYPFAEWATNQRRQLPNGDRLVLLRERKTAMSAVLTFFEKDGDLHWVIHIHDYHAKALLMFELLESEAEKHPIPSDYSGLPMFGRF
jgi:hypothetical protein